MGAQEILILFLFFYGAELLCSFWLSWLNTRNVIRHKEEPPERYKALIPLEKYAKHVDYTISRARFNRVSQIFSAVFFLAFLFYGGFGFVDQWSQSFSINPYWSGILFIYATSFIFSLVDIPFSLYSIFVIEERFGFNKMTLKLYFLDMFKGLLLSAILMTPILWVIFRFMDKTGDYWWVWVFFILMGFQIFLLFIFPIILAPLFNKFTPLAEGPLKEKIEALAQKLGFENSGIFVMDGSKRSGHGNAYFTGFGKSRRIVLYDTLLESLQEDQIVAVLAHEIGHCKLNHVKKSLLLSTVLLLVSLYVLSLLLPYEPFYQAFGIQNPSYAAALLLFSLCSGAFTFFLNPLFSGLTRKHEYEADAYAKKWANVNDLSEALMTLDKDNLSNLWPHPWYSFFYYSHPTTLERIQALEQGT